MKTTVAPESPATKATKKRTMSPDRRKALSDAAKARWATKHAPAPAAAPSPAVLQLQAQVVELVAQRQQARALLNEAHNAYLAAQARFQAAEGELKGIEQEVQYRISLIGQLENRTPTISNGMMATTPVLQMPSFSGVSSEPTPQARQQAYAEASADDLRNQVMRGSMM